MLSWLKDYNTHQQEANQKLEELKRKVQEEQNASKEFEQKHKDSLSNNIKDTQMDETHSFSIR